MCNVSRWGLSPFQGLAPGRAAKIRLQPRRRHFFQNFGHFRHHARDLFVSTTFSKTHKQARDPHRWIGLDLIYKGKLLRTQTNSRIARYLHFSDPFTPIFDSPVESKFPLPLYQRATARAARRNLAPTSGKSSDQA